tara:strand:+ start:2866 stop:4461 length:1596 start_codon:yes stop_codon:yes gene_type:complete
MKFWFKIVKENNGVGLLVFLSFIITFMGLLSPIFIIHIFNRYIAFGLQGTLVFLVLGGLSVAYLEYIFRNIRHNFCSKIILNPIKSIKISTLQIFFEKTNYTGFDEKKLLEPLDLNNNLLKTLNSQNQSNILDFFFAIFILIALFFLNFILASIFSIILTFALTYQLRSNVKKKEFISQNSKNITTTNILADVITKGTFLKVLNAFKFTAYNVSKSLDSQFKNNDYISRQSNYGNSMSNFLIVINSLIIIGLGSTFVVQGSLSIGTLIGFNIFSSRALLILLNAQKSFLNMRNIDTYFKKNENFFKLSYKSDPNMELSKIYGNISLKNLSFNFSGEAPLLQNLNFTFHKGDINVITGPNGSGKSTLCKLLLGVNTPSSGEIFIDNTNIKKLSIDWWRKQLGYIPQNTKCVNASIVENIRIGNPDISISEVGKLVQKVGLDTVLLKSNFDFEKNLSGKLPMGIHKKIHYARILAKDTQILILDDPCEHLDLSGKEFVLNFLSTCKKSLKTVICFSNDSEIVNVANKKYNLYD